MFEISQENIQYIQERCKGVNKPSDEVRSRLCAIMYEQASDAEVMRIGTLPMLHTFLTRTLCGIEVPGSVHGVSSSLVYAYLTGQSLRPSTDEEDLPEEDVLDFSAVGQPAEGESLADVYRTLKEFFEARQRGEVKSPSPAVGKALCDLHNLGKTCLGNILAAEMFVVGYQVKATPEVAEGMLEVVSMSAISLMFHLGKQGVELEKFDPGEMFKQLAALRGGGTFQEKAG